MSDGILSRWARRKQAVRAAERAETPPVPAPVPEAVPETAEAADALADAIARLPKIEDLTAQTDLSPFLRAGIPSALRNAALRRMWSVDPGIRDFVSEAREYAYDWNTPGGVPGLGPMLPTDDIAAMVERVLHGHAPVAKPDAPEPAAIEPDVETEAVVSGPVVSEADEIPKAIAHAEVPPVIPSLDPPTSFQSPTIVSRLRRHGGAMPG
jgi:hypothetical protein